MRPVLGSNHCKAEALCGIQCQSACTSFFFRENFYVNENILKKCRESAWFFLSETADHFSILPHWWVSDEILMIESHRHCLCSQQANNEQEDVLRPYSALDYAWDEPSLPHKLIVALPGNRRLGVFNLDKVSQVIYQVWFHTFLDTLSVYASFSSISSDTFLMPWSSHLVRS